MNPVSASQKRFPNHKWASLDVSPVSFHSWLLNSWSQPHQALLLPFHGLLIHHQSGIYQLPWWHSGLHPRPWWSWPSDEQLRQICLNHLLHRLRYRLTTWQWLDCSCPALPWSVDRNLTKYPPYELLGEWHLFQRNDHNRIASCHHTRYQRLLLGPSSPTQPQFLRFVHWLGCGSSGSHWLPCPSSVWDDGIQPCSFPQLQEPRGHGEGIPRGISSPPHWGRSHLLASSSDSDNQSVPFAHRPTANPDKPAYTRYRELDDPFSHPRGWVFQHARFEKGWSLDLLEQLVLHYAFFRSPLGHFDRQFHIPHKYYELDHLGWQCGSSPLYPLPHFAVFPTEGS